MLNKVDGNFQNTFLKDFLYDNQQCFLIKSLKIFNALFSNVWKNL